MKRLSDLDAALRGLWVNGWQPADVARLVDRELDKMAADIVSVAIRAGAAEYETLGRQVAPVWMSQVDALGSIGPTTADEARTLFASDADSSAADAAIERLLRWAGELPSLPCLLPPPPNWHAGMDGAPSGQADEAVLSRVRALLAKAERTTFEAEATAFMAKAQEIMARHRIDRAMLSDPTDHAVVGEHARGRRLGVDNPYPRGKYALLAAVSTANRCRAIWSPDLGFATVVGFPTDAAVVEELFTSLLVQATAAMQREGSKQDARGRNRTRAFRHAFLLAYAHRIGERLREAATAVETEADAAAGGALLPVLVSREEAVEETTTDLFPDLTSAPTTVSDREGVLAGRAHADRADLSVGAHLPR